MYVARNLTGQGWCHRLYVSKNVAWILHVHGMKCVPHSEACCPLCAKACLVCCCRSRHRESLVMPRFRKFNPKKFNVKTGKSASTGSKGFLGMPATVPFGKFLVTAFLLHQAVTYIRCVYNPWHDDIRNLFPCFFSAGLLHQPVAR